MQPTQLTLDAIPMLGLCWSGVADGGPTLSQQLVRFTYLLQYGSLVLVEYTLTVVNDFR